MGCGAPPATMPPSWELPPAWKLPARPQGLATLLAACGSCGWLARAGCAGAAALGRRRWGGGGSTWGGASRPAERHCTPAMPQQVLIPSRGAVSRPSPPARVDPCCAVPDADAALIRAAPPAPLPLSRLHPRLGHPISSPCRPLSLSVWLWSSPPGCVAQRPSPGPRCSCAAQPTLQAAFAAAGARCKAPVLNPGSPPVLPPDLQGARKQVTRAAVEFYGPDRGEQQPGEPRRAAV